jgi:hypothetical protein
VRIPPSSYVGTGEKTCANRSAHLCSPVTDCKDPGRLQAFPQMPEAARSKCSEHAFPTHLSQLTSPATAGPAVFAWRRFAFARIPGAVAVSCGTCISGVKAGRVGICSLVSCAGGREREAQGIVVFGVRQLKRGEMIGKKTGKKARLSGGRQVSNGQVARATLACYSIVVVPPRPHLRSEFNYGSSNGYQECSITQHGPHAHVTSSTHSQHRECVNERNRSA